MRKLVNGKVGLKRPQSHNMFWIGQGQTNIRGKNYKKIILKKLVENGKHFIKRSGLDQPLLGCKLAMADLQIWPKNRKWVEWLGLAHLKAIAH